MRGMMLENRIRVNDADMQGPATRSRRPRYEVRFRCKFPQKSESKWQKCGVTIMYTQHLGEYRRR